MKIDLSGKTALITGATGDLGRVMVTTFSECGADVAVNYYRNESKAKELCEAVTEKGRRALSVQADVTDFGSVLKMRDCVAGELAPPDIIVNNAVIQYEWKSILAQEIADYESQFQSCVMHNVYMAKAFVPSMVEKRWGRVIGINTECYLQCWPSQSAYASGKHGMNGFLNTLANETGPFGITVNQVAPGWMLSDRDRAKGLEKAEKESEPYTDMIPLRHRGEDRDIANVTVFLASDLARFITRAFIPVNGGGATVPTWV